MMRRRIFLGVAMAGFAGALDRGLAAAQTGQTKPFTIYRVTYRGRTEVEDGFDDYLASNGVAVRFIERNADHDVSRLPAFVQEIRETRPDLVYTWGTPVTLGIAGRYDAPDKQKFITDIPVVLSELAHSHLTWQGYCQCLKRTRIESVFAKDDPLPSVGELLLLPYLIAKKYC